MDRDLNRSLRLLEDALSPQGKSLLRTNTPKRSKPVTKVFDYDEVQDISAIPREVSFREEEQFTFTKDNSLSLIQNLSVTGVSASSRPWENPMNSLFIEYLEIIQARTSTPQIFETVSDLARCCSDTLNVVRSLKSKVRGTVDSEERWLENERNTWRLIYCLYQDRLSFDTQESAQYFGVSEKLCIENLYRRDSLMRESQLIIDWLECNEHDKESFTPRVEYFTDKTVGWENTLHQLQSEETIVFKSNRPIVTEIDPDAPIRQRKPLHDLDVEDDARLCKKIFSLIRCGKFDEAQKLCVHCGHPWRAVLLEGWRLYHDPNANHNENNDKSIRHPVEGNENRDLWKNMAWQYCFLNDIDIYERATVASFCGCLDTMLIVCQSWEDTLWAYMKTMVDIRVESEIRDYVSRKYRPLPQEYWKNKMSIDDIFVKLSSSSNPKIRKESEEPDHVIQKYIILDQISELMLAIDNWLAEEYCSPQFVRFLAHLILFLKQIGHSKRDDIAEKVLELYVQILIGKNEPQLVAYYTATLGKQTQIDIFTSFLENITDNTERKQALQYAEDSGLDIKVITKTVTEKIINKQADDLRQLSVLPKYITESDKIKISALDWVLFYPSQNAEAIYQSNSLVSYFLILGKLESAKLAFSKIPPNAIDSIFSGCKEEVPEHIHKWIREYLSYKAYLDAHESFNDWFKYYHHSKPVAPAPLAENPSFPEKVAHEHKLTQYQADCERWKMTVMHLAKTAKTMLYNVLLFPDGGWLVGAEKADHLRSQCIPETVLLLYSVMSETDEHSECMQLADIITSEKYQLYKVYSKTKLEDFFQKLVETSVKLLDEKNDMWSS